MTHNASEPTDIRGHFRLAKPPKTGNENENHEADPLDLTFGVEIECLVLRDTRPNRTTATGVPPTGREKIHEILSQPLTSRCSSCQRKHIWHLPLNSVKPDDPEYNKWTVDEDKSLGITQREKTAFRGEIQYLRRDQIEIKSRVIHAGKPLLTTKSNSDPGHTHSVCWSDEIKTVYETLVDAFNKPPGIPKLRLVTNPSCGLHVHIGNGKKGFPLKTVKNVLSMCVANEAAIDSIHSVDRITGSTLAFSEQTTDWLEDNYTDEVLDTGTYNVPWSQHFHWIAFDLSLAKNSSQDTPAWDNWFANNRYPSRAFDKYPSLRETAKQNDVPSWMKLIRSAERIKDLQDLQGAMGHNSTINLTNLLNFSPEGNNTIDGRPRKMTVEFRQHAATLHPTEVVPWINVLLSLFTFCHEHSLLDIKTLCEKTWSNPSHTALHLLKVINVPKETYMHYKTFLGKRSNPMMIYAQASHTRELEHAAVFGPDDFFLPMVQEIIEERTEALNNVESMMWMREKLVNGCYGQFEAGHVEKLGLSSEVKRKLTIGWKPDRSGKHAPPPEPQPIFDPSRPWRWMSLDEYSDSEDD